MPDGLSLNDWLTQHNMVQSSVQAEAENKIPDVINVNGVSQSSTHIPVMFSKEMSDFLLQLSQDAHLSTMIKRMSGAELPYGIYFLLGNLVSQPINLEILEHPTTKTHSGKTIYLDSKGRIRLEISSPSKNQRAVFDLNFSTNPHTFILSKSELQDEYFDSHRKPSSTYISPQESGSNFQTVINDAITLMQELNTVGIENIRHVIIQTCLTSEANYLHQKLLNTFQSYLQIEHYFNLLITAEYQLTQFHPASVAEKQLQILIDIYNLIQLRLSESKKVQQHIQTPSITPGLDASLSSEKIHISDALFSSMLFSHLSTAEQQKSSEDFFSNVLGNIQSEYVKLLTEQSVNLEKKGLIIIHKQQQYLTKMIEDPSQTLSIIEMLTARKLFISSIKPSKRLQHVRNVLRSSKKELSRESLVVLSHPLLQALRALGNIDFFNTYTNELLSRLLEDISKSLSTLLKQLSLESRKKQLRFEQTHKNVTQQSLPPYIGAIRKYLHSYYKESFIGMFFDTVLRVQIFLGI